MRDACGPGGPKGTVSTQAAVATTSPGSRPHSTNPRASGAGWRYGATGVASSILYGLVVGALGLLPALSAQAAHLVATAVSTVTGSALHRGFTFRGGPSASWRRSQLAGGGTALVGMGMSTLALTLWHHAVPHSGRLGDVVLVYAVNGLMGLVNFFVMRRVLRAEPALRPETVGG